MSFLLLSDWNVEALKLPTIMGIHVAHYRSTEKLTILKEIASLHVFVHLVLVDPMMWFES